MKNFLFITTLIVVTSCNINTENSHGNEKDSVVIIPGTGAPADAIETKAPAGNIENCYRFIAQKDTYDIKITRTGNEVSGFMHFNNYQKDDSRGKFTGKIVKDNIMKVIYKFESEGMKSTREIFLKDNGDEIITGIGEEDVKGDSAFIKNPDAVKFTGAVYKKIDCSF